MRQQGIQRHLIAVADRYRSFSLRERVLVSLSVVAVTWFAWSATLGGYLQSMERRMDGDVSAADQRIRSAMEERSQLLTAKASDPNARLAEQRDRLDAQITDLRNSLGSLLDHFVDPERMPSLLEDVIRRHGKLTLTRIENLPPEPIDVSKPKEDGEEPAPVWIYRHPLRIEFEGRYFDVMDYLAELERGAWKFGWRELSYEVRDYPVARVTLQVETLSRERSWLGV